MENKNIILLKHLPSVYFKLGDPAYRNQVEDNYDDYVVVDVTSNVVRDKKFMAEHPNFDKELSPFYIGPVVGPDGAKANIFESVWGENYLSDDNTVKVHMSNIRSKLKKLDSDTEYIETVWGMGYRLIN